jgi:hypothetical protein
MEWKRIPKENSRQPEEGTYSDWKPLLAEEGFHQCVYCAIPEPQFGGIRNFHIEHYKPKSRREFEHLINDIRNLFYACAICNTFKGADWPSDPVHNFSNPSYPDPGNTCYEEIFSREEGGLIRGRYTAAVYMIEKLYLNRPQLLLERRIAKIFSRFEELQSFLAKVIPMLKDVKDSSGYMARIASFQNDMIELLVKLRKLPPYKNEDVRR